MQTAAAPARHVGDHAWSNEVCVGVVGAGEQGAGHLLPALQQVPGARVVGLADLKRERQGAVGDRFGITARAATALELLDRVALDALVVACPPEVHEEVLALAISRGIPVMVEKPPAGSTERLTALAVAAQKAGATTAVGMNFRWSEPVTRIRALLGREGIGHPVSIIVQHEANKPTGPLWGMSYVRSFLLAQSIHPLDLIVDLGGGQPSGVVATCHLDESSFHAGIQGYLPNGGICSFVTGLHRGRLRSRIEITTSTGVSIELLDLSHLRVVGLDGDGSWANVWQPSPMDSGYRRTGFHHELAAFVAAVARRQTFTPGIGDLIPSYTLIDLICDAGGAP